MRELEKSAQKRKKNSREKAKTEELCGARRKRCGF
jgi:hypothetical protein